MERSKNHLDFLDQIRGIAIIAVFLFHSLNAAFGCDQLAWDGWFRDFNVSRSFLFFLPLSFGWAGVAIFFVVSGFCIHLSFARKPDWRDFRIRRFFRIYPPYFFAVLLFAFLIPWTCVGYGSSGMAQLLDHLALAHNFNNSSYFGINPAFWSIAVEVQLYLLYPVLLMLVARFGWYRSLAGIAALEIGLRASSSAVLITTGQSIPLWFSGIPFLYWFSWSIGAVIADAHLCGRKLPFSNHSLLAWSAIAFGSCFLKPLASFSFLFFALLTATTITKLIKREGRPIRFPVFSAPLRMVGIWSFSIYLLHHPFLLLASRLVEKFQSADMQRPLVIFAVCLCFWFPIIALSALWYRVFELPSIAVGKKLASNGSLRANQEIPRPAFAMIGREEKAGRANEV